MIRTALLAWIAATAALSAAPRSAAPREIPRAPEVPLFFIANRGQAPPEVRFMAQGSGLTAWFSPHEALFRMADVSLRLEFPGAATASLEGLGRLRARASFLTGDAGQWRLAVPLYGAVRYRDLFPGIDLTYGAQGRHLKSEFTVAPGADPARIRLRYSEADDVRLEETGALVVRIRGHELREEAPVLWQDGADGARIPVEGRFTLAPDGTVGFSVKGYDSTRPLTIDPVLSYSTLLGGSSSDAAMALAVDSTGSAYVAGFTASFNFPTATPAQNFNAGGNDIFVARLNPSGTGLVYCTYIGGRGDDRAYAIAIDASGLAYLTGSTTSTNFPVRSAMQSRLTGAKNAFVLKLNATGNGIAFNTYLGGNGSDSGNGIALDSAGNVYVVGDTTSTTFPATAMQKGNHGSQDAFVSKLTSEGSLVYSTYLGGENDDHGAAIAIASGGEACVTGSTWSPDFPRAAAWQNTLAGGQDAFAARLSADGNSLVFGTFLGGAGGTLGYPEAGQAIALGPQGNIYIAGVTSSADFPLLQPLQLSRRGSMDAFVTKLTSAGVPSYSTYLGGSGVDMANAIAVDASENAYVVGQTFSSDLPVINAAQSASGGDYDAFWAVIAPAGNSLLYLSYLGGNGSDTATAVALDASGSLYVAGWTLSTNFPLLNAFQSTNSGNYGAFVARFAPGAVLTVVSVSPGSGSAASQTFSFQFSDSAGATDLSSVSVLFQSSAVTTNACAVTYFRASNTLALLTDSGAAPAGSITPGSGSQQNTQCVLNGAGSSVSLAGSVLTLNLALTFQPVFSGARNIYMQAANASASTGWQQRGTWTVPAAGPPTNDSVTPSSGTGTSQTFVFAFSDPYGYASIISTQIIFNNPIAVANGCYLRYVRASNAVYLTNDAGTVWQTPITLGQSGTLQNTQCSVNVAASSASGSGNTLTLNLALTFKAVFTGPKLISMEVYDGRADSGWQQRGAWTIPGTGPPSAVSVSPSSGTGTSQTFSFVFSDPNGYAAVVSTQIIFNNPISVANGCYIRYVQASNSLYLTNDAGTAWQTPIPLGQSGTLQNSQCSLNPAASSASGVANTLTLNIAVTFKSVFTGSKNVYMEVYDNPGDSGWQQRGIWTIPGTSGPPTPVSVTPGSGSGSSQTFSFVFSDPDGYASILSAQIIFNNPISVANGCYLLFYRSSNTIYLTNDAGTAWQSPLTLGQSGTLQNSQCTVSASASSSSGNGNTLTVNLALTFKPAFTGAKYIYTEVYDGTGDSGWQQRGTWTIP